MNTPLLLVASSDWALGVCIGMPLMVVLLLVLFSLPYLLRAGIGRLLDTLFRRPR